MKGLKDKREEKIFILTSGVCNNKCIFCFDRGEKKSEDLGYKNVFLRRYNSFFLSIDGFEKQLKSLKKKSSTILFTGGEPTLNKNLISFIEMSKKAGLKRIALMTNGRTLSSKDYFISLLKAGLNDLSISFHGSSAKIQEKMTRSKGSFEQTLSALLLADKLKRKFNFKFTINTTVSKINYKDIPNLFYLFSSFKNLDYIILNAVVFKGNALRYIDKVAVRYEKIVEQIKKASENFSSFFLKKVYINGIPYCLLEGLKISIENEDAMLMEDRKVEGKFNREITDDYFNKIKRPACRKCLYNNICPGVPSNYIKKFGWREFKPVIKNKN